MRANLLKGLRQEYLETDIQVHLYVGDSEKGIRKWGISSIHNIFFINRISVVKKKNSSMTPSKCSINTSRLLNDQKLKALARLLQNQRKQFL